MNNVNENTMNGAWYRPYAVGMQVMDDIISKLLDFSPEKISQIENAINNLEPASESSKVWNQLKVPENEKLRLAHIATAIWEIENKLRIDSKNN